MTFERSAAGGSNWRDLADNVRANDEEADRASVEAQPMAGETPDAPLRIVIRRLVIEGVIFTIRRPDGTTASGTLPAIELADVGGAEGTTAAGLGKVVVLAMARELFKHLAAERLRDRLGRLDVAPAALDAVRIRAAVEQNVALSSEQRERVRSILEQQSRDLRAAIDALREQGFLTLGSLPELFAPVLSRARRELAEVLRDEQMGQIETVFETLQQATTEEIRAAIVDESSRRLVLRPKQSERLRPLLLDALRERSQLPTRLAATPDLTFDEFRAELRVLQEATRQRLQETLDHEQAAAFSGRQQLFRDFVQEAYFGGVEQ